VILINLIRCSLSQHRQSKDKLYTSLYLHTHNKDTLFYGEGFEIFHSFWEALCRTVKTRNTQRWSTHYQTNTLKDEFKISSNVILCEASENEFRDLLNGKSKITDLLTGEAYDLNLLIESEAPVIITLGNRLPGFDIFIMDRNVKNELAITLVQTKYSKLESTTTYNAFHIEKSLKHMREFFKDYIKDYENLLLFGEPNTNPPASNEILHFGNEILKSKNIRAVFVLFAKTTETLKSTNNVCVINRDQLLDVYGPTIYSLIRDPCSITLVQKEEKKG